MTTVHIPGSLLDPSQDAIETERTLRYGLTPEHVVDVRATRGTGATVSVTAADRDVLELEYEGGLVDVLSVADAHRTAPPSRDDGGIVLPTETGPLSRGGPSGLLRRVRSYRLPSVEDLIRDGIVDVAARTSAGALARGLVRWNEEQLYKGGRGPGLYLVTDDLALGERVDDPTRLDAAGPFLVLIHGTFSSSEAFSGLRDTREWDELVERYPQRILALEHRTLSVNPVENALDLAGLVPEGARLHLLTHSRGGLVGEFVSAGAPTEAQLERFRRARSGGADAEIALLRKLAEMVDDRGIRVQRFVRVAGPAGGTLLADRRIDRYLKVMLNVVKLVPGFAGNPVYGFVKSLALSLIGKRADVDDVPGVEAMMPDSPYIALLATTTRRLDDGLAVVAGDIAASGILARLKVLATDLYYREDHDLVVNTRSMYRGAPRDRVYASFQRGADISHSAYFGHEVTRARIRNWLVHPDDAPGAVARGFEPVPAAGVLSQPDNVSRSEAGATRPAVVFVPAQFTTELRRGERIVWPDVAALADEGVAGLRGDLRPGDVVDVGYGTLLGGLTADATVMPFPWDWREPPDVVGPKLAEVVAELLDQGRERVSILAHSGGGLVALWLRDHCPELWQRLRSRGGWMVLAGTPFGRARAVSGWLAGTGDLVGQLALVDPEADRDDVAATLGGFPGVRRLAGAAPADGRAGNWDGVCLVTSTDGDFVDASQLPARLPVWSVPLPYRSLLSTSDAVEGIGDLLAGGTTTRLAVGMPSNGRGPSAATAADEGPPPPLPFPTGESLVASGLGDLPTTTAADPRTRLRIEVFHGDLRHADVPVMVGHYSGSPLEGAEGVLDRQLDGRLGDRQLMGLYPGTPDDAVCLLAPTCNPPGAVVVGLGPQGELTAERLTTAVTMGALEYAAAIADLPMEAGETLPRPARLTAVVIGSSGSAGLSITSSVAAIVKGVVTAQGILASHGISDRVVLDDLRFVERYADRAEVAARAVAEIPDRLGAEIGDLVELDPDRYLQEWPGGLPGQPPADYSEGVWRRLKIDGVRDEPHTRLSFVAIGGRAGTDTLAHRVENPIVDGLLASAVGTANPGAQINNTLFELLLPTEEKTQLRDADNLHLLLDPVSAGYPWEVLAGRGMRGITAPLALRSGLLRQLRLDGVRRTLSASSGQRALVIGDPPGGGDYPRLAQARAEAHLVADLLEQHGYDVTRLIADEAGEPTWEEILNALFAHEYRILHIAAHGVYRPSTPAASGVVIGPDRYLTAQTVQQAPSVPSLVFLNCCHLGAVAQRAGHTADVTAADPRAATTANLHRLAASVSASLMGIGVDAVVAAGWAVDDAAAAAFAGSFYRRLLEGYGYGDAVRLARLDAHEADQGRSNTWGAYQCYGDPAFRLRTARESLRTRSSTVAWPALIRRLEAIRHEAADGGDAAALAAEVRGLADDVPTVWHQAEVEYAFGAVWAELGDYDRAIAYYQQALQCWDADAPLRVLEQLGNMEVRSALRSHDAGADADGVQQLFTTALERFEQLLAIAATPERHALVGSFHKKRARTRPAGRARSADVRRARDAYARAVELNEQHGQDEPWQVINHLQMCWLLGEPPEDWQERLDHARRLADRDGTGNRSRTRAAAARPTPQRRGTNGWAALAAPDGELTAALIEGRLSEQVDTIAARYEDVAAAASARVRLSVAEHLGDLAALARDATTAAALARLRGRLHPA